MKQNIMTRLSLAGVGSLALSLVCTQVQAATIQFDNRVAFENATTSLNIETETFNSFDSSNPNSDVVFPSTNNPADGLDVGAFFLSRNSSRINVSRITAYGSDRFNIDGTPFVRGIGDAGDSLTFLFKEATTAFGIDLSSINESNVNRTEVIIGSETFTLPTVSEPFVKTFFGVTSDSPFTTVTFSAVEFEYAGLDNVSFEVSQSDTAAVPESGFTLALLALGALGLFKVMSKK